MASAALLPPLDFNRLRSLESPKERTIKAFGLELKKKMFTNGLYYYNIYDIKDLLNVLSSQDERGRHDAAPNPQNIPWGDALLSALAIKDNLNKIGAQWRSIYCWHHCQLFGRGIWLFCRREVSTVKCCSYLTVFRESKIGFALQWYLNGMDILFR